MLAAFGLSTAESAPTATEIRNNILWKTKKLEGYCELDPKWEFVDSA